MNETTLREDILEIKNNQTHQSEAISTLTVTCAEMGVALRQLAQTQQAQADHDRRLIILEEARKTAEDKLQRLEADIAAERKERKEDRRWFWVLVITLLAAVVGAIVTKLLH